MVDAETIVLCSLRVACGQPNMDDDAFCAAVKLQKQGSHNQVQGERRRLLQRWQRMHRPCKAWGEPFLS